ncbi:hypothetical protein Tco_1314652 [Tanacetum coccineum]
MRNTKDFEAKYNKVKAKPALLSSSASAPSSFSSKNKGLIAESYDWDEEEVSSDDEETKVKALITLTDEERIYVGKESAKNGEWTKITIKKVHTFLEMEDNDDRKSFLDYNSDMSITSSNLHKSSEAKDSTLPNHDTDEVPSNKSQRNITDPLAIVFDSSVSDYDLADESLVCSTPLLPLKKLDGVEPGSGLKTTNSAHAGNLKNVKVEDDPPLAMVMKELNGLKLQISKKKSSYSRNKNTLNRKRETPHAKKVESSNALKSKTPTKK